MDSKDNLITELQGRLSTTVEQLTLEHQLKLNQLLSQVQKALFSPQRMLNTVKLLILHVVSLYPNDYYGIY